MTHTYRKILCRMHPSLLHGISQYDSDGSDSQESCEEAVLRRKKIEALKVRLLFSFWHVWNWFVYKCMFVVLGPIKGSCRRTQGTAREEEERSIWAREESVGGSCMSNFTLLVSRRSFLSVGVVWLMFCPCPACSTRSKGWRSGWSSISCSPSHPTVWTHPSGSCLQSHALF